MDQHSLDGLEGLEDPGVLLSSHAGEAGSIPREWLLPAREPAQPSGSPSMVGAGFGWVQIHPASSGWGESPSRRACAGSEPHQNTAEPPSKGRPNTTESPQLCQRGRREQRDQMDEENLPCWHKAPCRKNPEAFVARCHPLHSCPSPPESRHSPSSHPHPGREPGAHSGM